jgi:hypothetical protein
MQYVLKKPHSIIAILTTLSLLSILCASSLEAAPNYEINYQGKLTNAANVAVANGTYNMRFWPTTSPIGYR